MKNPLYSILAATVLFTTSCGTRGPLDGFPEGSYIVIPPTPLPELHEMEKELRSPEPFTLPKQYPLPKQNPMILPEGPLDVIPMPDSLKELIKEKGLPYNWVSKFRTNEYT